MATTVARLQAILSANTHDFDRAMSKSETRMQKVGGAAKLMGGALAVGLGIELKRAVDAALDAERSQARLEVAFKNAHVAIGPLKGAIEDAGKAAINMGFDDERAADSLGSLVIATGNFKTARKDLNVAMDIARFKNIDLEAATKMLTMAMGGSQRAVKQLGISVPPVTSEYDRLKAKFGDNISKSEELRLKTAKLEDKQATAAKVIDTVRQKVRGQADAYAKTASGEMEVFSAKIEELEEDLGKKLLPKLTEVVGGLIRFVDWLEKVDKWMSNVGANKGLKESLEGIKGPSGIDIVKDLWQAWQAVSQWIAKSWQNLKGFMEQLGKLKGPSGLDLVRKVTGDADPMTFKRVGQQFGSASAKDVSPALFDELAGAQHFGLRMTSGYRPGAVTKHGTPSDHGKYPSKAIDVAGPPNRMASFFRWLIGQTDVKQAFYDPLGSIFGGALSSYREGGHSDHVHVATYDQGGYLKPGWNLAYNGTGAPEPVGAGTVNIYMPNYMGSEQAVFAALQNWGRQHMRRNGRRPF